jgi:beta-lactamase class A
MKRKFNILFIFLCFFLLSCTREEPPRIDKDHFKLQIEKIASEQLSSGGVDYSVLVKGLDTDSFNFCIGENKQFPAASIIKVPILASALMAVDEGKISLSDKIVIEKKDITGGSGVLKAAKLPYATTVERLIELMISASDNTASNKIIDMLGFDYLRGVFSKLELNDTVLARKIMDMSMRNRGVENYTSARDVARIFEFIYSGSLLSEDLSRKALSFLAKQKVNDRIPKLLPKELKIAHKTGLERGVIHDAGIVFTDSGDYLICILVKNERSYTKGKKFIAHVSLLTYNLFIEKFK